MVVQYNKEDVTEKDKVGGRWKMNNRKRKASEIENLDKRVLDEKAVKVENHKSEKCELLR